MRTKKTNACIVTQQKQKQISCANIIINRPIVVLGALGPPHFFLNRARFRVNPALWKCSTTSSPKHKHRWFLDRPIYGKQTCWICPLLHWATFSRRRRHSLILQWRNACEVVTTRRPRVIQRYVHSRQHRPRKWGARGPGPSNTPMGAIHVSLTIKVIGL